MDCIYVAHDSDKWGTVVTTVGKWRAVVTTVGMLGFHKSRGTFWVAENILVPEEGIFGFG